jgi:hypothetical protein
VRFRALALLCAIACSFPSTASAQTARGTNADVTGYVGTGDLVIGTTIAGASVTLGGHISLEERGSRLRIDVLSLAIPGMDPTLSALASGQLFPPGGFTVSYDRRDATYAVWSSGKHAYYMGGGRATNADAGGSPSAFANPAAGAIANGANLFDAFGALRGLKDDSAFSASVALTGHTKLFGHPVTGVSYKLTQSALAGNASLDAHGELELADDLDEVPVRVTATVTTGSIPQSSLRLDLTSLAKQTPDDADFAPPRDYTRAKTVGEVIGR